MNRLLFVVCACLAIVATIVKTNRRTQQKIENQGPVTRRLNAATINAAVAEVLPYINEAFRLKMEDDDPLEIDKDVEKFDSLELSDGPCNGEVVLASAAIAEISGQSSAMIDSFELVEGTETFETGCPTEFTGRFKFDISAEEFIMSGTSNYNAASCSTYDSDYEGGVIEPYFFGDIYLEGTIDSDRASFSKTEVKAIEVSCASAGLTTTGILKNTDYESIYADFDTQIGDEFKTAVQEKMIPVITDAINFAVMNYEAPTEGCFSWMKKAAAFVASFGNGT